MILSGDVETKSGLPENSSKHGSSLNSCYLLRQLQEDFTLSSANAYCRNVTHLTCSKINNLKISNSRIPAT